MSQVKMTAFKTDPLVPLGCWVEGIHDDYEGFRILLHSNKRKQRYRIRFGYCFHYLVSEESKRLRQSFDFTKSEGAIYKASESAFIDWAFAEQLEITDKVQFSHYLICGDDCLVEVLTSAVPTTRKLPY